LTQITSTTHAVSFPEEGRIAIVTDAERDAVDAGSALDETCGRGGLPLMLNLYVSRLKEAGAPLHPRIDSEMANHLGYVDGALKGREFFVGNSLTGADIQMSFVGDMAKVFNKLGPYPNLSAWLLRMHARPAFQRSIEKGGAYRFAK
jgi:glutathione S-transferase